MKKILTMAYLAAAVLGATMTLSSCSNDNEDDGTFGAAVNPKTVFTGGLPKSVAGMTIQTNDKGQVISIKDRKNIVTFQYSVAGTRTGASTPNVIMTIGQGKKKQVCNLFLNKDGFVKHCDETGYDVDGEEYLTGDFTYKNDGQLLTMQRSDGGNEKTIIKYQGGNIVEVSDVDGEEAEWKVYYTSQTVSTPIENKGCIMLFRDTFGIGMGEMQFAYYAGLLGKATKNLPVALEEVGAPKMLFSWTLNSAGYPISFKGNEDTFSFSW